MKAEQVKKVTDKIINAIIISMITVVVLSGPLTLIAQAPSMTQWENLIVMVTCAVAGLITVARCINIEADRLISKNS